VTLAAGTGIGACGGTDDRQPAGGETSAPFHGPVDTGQVEVPPPEPMPPTGIRPDEIPEPAPPMAGIQALEEPDASTTPTVDLPVEATRPTKGIRPDPPEDLAPPAAKPKQPQVQVKPPKAPTRGITNL
jgi:hypothetical protein